MGYTSDHILLKSTFKSSDRKIDLPDSDLVMQKHTFESSNSLFLSAESSPNEYFQLSSMPDRYIPENRMFEYPLIRSKKINKDSKLIIMLHGLNEKSWDKYWTWAKALAENTGHTVLLFPLSFHMDRVPNLWSDPRKMTRLMQLRQEKYPGGGSMSFINAALSERLENIPERFVLSGYQSMLDLVELVKSIKAGLHKDFEADTHIDIFGYSIGAFFSQVLLIANPHSLFSDSKFLLFSGGAVFSDINGASRFIMDEPAFKGLHNFYTHEKRWSRHSLDEFQEVMSTQSFGNPFRAMLSLNTRRKLRERSFEEFSDRIKVISLKKDHVFPFKKILSAFRKNMSSVVEILDAPFFYTHENPFPISSKPCIKNHADEMFDKIFYKAGQFLAS